jgi:L-2-hydroxyglutarate oxidase LhgO
MEQVEVTIIGAGVVGLAIAAELSSTYQVLVLERNEKIGMETSSRNSEVIHAGIYYDTGSLKARLCIEGNRALYELCSKYGIGHKRIGKIIVATEERELSGLRRLLALGQANGADLEMISAEEVHSLEPNVNAIQGVLSRNTGIIDSHGLMKHFQTQAKKQGATFAYKSRVVGIAKEMSGYCVTVADGDEEFSFMTRILINAAGLHSHEIAALAGIDIQKAGYMLHY